MSSEMTSLERVLAIIKGETPDYIPVFPMLNEYASKLLGIGELEYYRDTSRLAEGQMQLVRYFKHDFLLPFTYLAKECASLGGRIQYHEDSSPTIGGILAKTPEELVNLEIPDFENNSETKIVLDQIRKLSELSEGKYPIIGVSTGPFSWPTLIMGNDQWLTALIMEEPQTINAVLKKAQEFSIAWSNAQIEAGCHVIALAEGSSTKSVIPEDVFETYVKPKLSKCVEQIKAPIMLLGVGGAFESYLNMINETGMGGVVVSTDDNLEQCLSNARNLIIAGNINNLEFMDYSNDDIDSIVKYSMNLGKGKRYILSTQYVLPRMVDESKIKMMISAARKYGKM